MRYRVLLIALLLILLPAGRATAYSDLAEDFLLACRRLDTQFPPADWSADDLRFAALEVLDAYESDGLNDWAVYFCLVTLGYTRCAEDMPRILAYEDTMTEAVVRSLSGWPNPDAVECLLRQVESEDASYRELAVGSLAEMDFEEMEDPGVWRERVAGVLRDALAAEPFEPIAELISATLTAIESSADEAD